MLKSTPTLAISFTKEERSWIMILWPSITTSTCLKISIHSSCGQTQRVIPSAPEISHQSSNHSWANQLTHFISN
jgi:hypothetical protein